MPPSQDADNIRVQRPRAGTTTLSATTSPFTSFWKRAGSNSSSSSSSNTQEQQDTISPSSSSVSVTTINAVSSPLPTSLSLSPMELIETLKPSNVPSLQHARALATVLSASPSSSSSSPDTPPLPSLEALTDVLFALCNPQSPPGIWVAGYDILSAYLENPQRPTPRTAVRVSCLSLFKGDDKLLWTSEVWESRLRALRALTDGENGTLALEADLLQILQAWLRGAFEPLLGPAYDWHDKARIAERERAIDGFMTFLCSLLERKDMMARVRERELGQLLQFFLDMINKALDVPMPEETVIQASPEPMTPVKPPTHRRNLSSLSLGASASSSHNISPPIIQKPVELKQHPSSVIVPAFLKYLSLRIKHLEPSHLDNILPSLFRSLSFFYSPLPRLTLNTQVDPSTLGTEGKLTSILDALLAGPYTYTCQRILKKHLLPPPTPIASDTDAGVDITAAIQISTGAHRTLRHLIRRGLSTRLARAYIARESSTSYAPSGVPVRLDLPPDLFERAWPKDEAPGLTINTVKLGRVLALAVGAWIDHGLVASPAEIVGSGRRQTPVIVGREKILDEAAGTVRDILEELDGRDGSVPVDDDEAAVVGEALYALAKYLHPLKNPDGSPWLIPFARPTDAPSPFLRTLSSLLVREHTLYMQPLLATTLLSVVDHLSDAQSARLPVIMFEQQELSPTSFDWLANWTNIFTNRAMLGGHARVLTRTTVMEALSSVFKSVKDMPTYRRPLVDLVYAFCERRLHEDGSERTGADPDMPWSILSEEIVLKVIEDPPLENTSRGNQDEPDAAVIASVENIISLLISAAMGKEEDNVNNDAVSLTSLDQPAHPYSSTLNLHLNTSSPSPLHSPVLSRMQSDPPRPERESGLISILSSLASGSSRSQSQQASTYEEPQADPMPRPLESIPSHSPDQPGRSTFAVAALIYAFSGIAFNPAADSEKSGLAKQLFCHLIDIMSEAGSTRARLTSLQFLMRLRAGRDHGVYYSPLEYSSQDNVTNLAKRINRHVPLRRERSESSAKDNVAAASVAIVAGEMSQEEYSRQARARDRVDPKKTSRGRAPRPSHSSTARSRSRIASLARASGGAAMTATVSRNPLWMLSETLVGTSSEALSFTVMFADMASRYLVMYDEASAENTHVLPISRYLTSIVAILEKERDWEILSYVLCHLPVQLSNKHLFCGPKCRAVTVNLLDVTCQGIINGKIGAVDVFTPGVKARDACGLAYQTLGVLISYRRCFDIPRRNRLVETLEQGLEEQQETIKSCLRSLALAAHELQTAMTRRLSKILERLSQIMSNPDVAVHIINFLYMVGCIRDLHVNFTEADYKMVFAVALQYLQHSNRRGASFDGSWALSQHMRIMSYALVYLWFLALKLPDRPKHITFITRQLLLANEDNKKVDEPTEVCFDWLARYTYASADPRPATSVIRDLIMNPTTVQPEPEVPVSEKTWVLGNSIVTIRSLTKLGWIEIISRRPSGETKFLCRVENFPLVGPGDVEPDLISLPAMLLEHGPPNPAAFMPGQEDDAANSEEPVQDENNRPERPNPVTGYVWSGVAPSQRRKDVSVDPSFFALQLSSYPYMKGRQNRLVTDNPLLPRLFRTLDNTPVIDTHGIGVLYVGPGQSTEDEILRNEHGSPAYTRFLEGIGRLVDLRGQKDIYVGQLGESNLYGRYTYAWWDDIGQVLFHTATMMPTRAEDPKCMGKKAPIGNDYVRIVWNDSGLPYAFDTLQTQFQFVNIVIEPHSRGAVFAAFGKPSAKTTGATASTTLTTNEYDNEYYRVSIQLAPTMTDFSPIGDFIIVSAESLPMFIRQTSLLADWFTRAYVETDKDTSRREVETNWRRRLVMIKNFKQKIMEEADKEEASGPQPPPGVMGEQAFRDFTSMY